MPSAFDTATAVTPEGDHFTAELDGGWHVGGGINGGYLLATIGRALGRSFEGKPDPLAVSAFYISAARPGPATIDVTAKRVGGRVATAAAELRQGDDVRVSVLATYGDLDNHTGDVRTTATPFDLPPLDECVSNRTVAEQSRTFAPLMERFEIRFHPDQAGWMTQSPSGAGVLSGWFRLEDEREPDPLSLLLALDALPPVSFDLGQMGWAPTLELTTHVRAKPAPGWLKVRHETRNVAGGMFEEDCEVWDSAGRLVAQSRQLAMLPR